MLCAQGEMSATVFYHPGSYLRLIPQLRSRLTSGSISASNVKIGVSTNFDKLCGCVLQARPHGASFAPVFEHHFRMAMTIALLDRCQNPGSMHRKRSSRLRYREQHMHAGSACVA